MDSFRFDEKYLSQIPALQVLVNLINNARDASPAESTIHIDGERIAASIQISVADEGSGIPEAIRDRVFEPFFTTRPPGEGAGLGLPAAQVIVKAHQGHQHQREHVKQLRLQAIVRSPLQGLQGLVTSAGIEGEGARALHAH